jgi:hypothetical protein
MGKESVSAGTGWAGKNVAPLPEIRPAHRLARIRKRDAHYSSRRGSRCALLDGFLSLLRECSIVMPLPWASEFSRAKSDFSQTANSEVAAFGSLPSCRFLQ